MPLGPLGLADRSNHRFLQTRTGKAQMTEEDSTFQQKPESRTPLACTKLLIPTTRRRLDHLKHLPVLALHFPGNDTHGLPPEMDKQDMSLGIRWHKGLGSKKYHNAARRMKRRVKAFKTKAMDLLQFRPQGTYRHVRTYIRTYIHTYIQHMHIRSYLYTSHTDMLCKHTRTDTRDALWTSDTDILHASRIKPRPCLTPGQGLQTGQRKGGGEPWATKKSAASADPSISSLAI